VIHEEAQLLLAAGAALDDLAPPERAAYDRHREGCAACAMLEDELGIVLADLSLLVPERVPPPDLLAGIRLAIVAEDSRNGVRNEERPRSRVVRATETRGATPAASPIPDNVVHISAGGPRRALHAALGLAAVFALAAIGLGSQAAALQDALDRSTAQVGLLQDRLQAQGAVMAAAMNPLHVAVALHAEPLAPDATASVVFVPGTDRAWVVADGLPATPSGHGYQLWYADDAGVHPLQTIAFDGAGTFVAPLGVDLASSSAVMITLERAAGSTGQPGEQVVFGEL